MIGHRCRACMGITVGASIAGCHRMARVLFAKLQLVIERFELPIVERNGGVYT